MYDLGLGAMEGMGKLATRAVQGIASAMRTRGATRQEVATLVAPLAKSIAYGSRQPKFAKAAGGLTIEHVEAVGYSPESNEILQVSSESFSWLRNIASQFEEYQIKVSFAWNPTCPATTLGTVLLAFDYDPIDPVAYATTQDYFNTADHCISATWSPAAISPERSGWLKTGTRGDSRLWSPGNLHYHLPAHLFGFLVVKYQVSLRKPQPTSRGLQGTIRGTFASTHAIFSSSTTSDGSEGLFIVTGSMLTILPTEGYKTVTWTSDADFSTLTPVVVGGKIIASRAGTDIGFVVQVSPGNTAQITATTNWVAGDYACMTSVVQSSGPVTYN